MSNPIKVGVIGLGRSGNGMHLDFFSKHRDLYEVVAVCDLIEERRKKAADRFGCRTYEKDVDFVKDPDIEIVFVATRSCDHYRHAVMAMEAGKSVFVEKPIALNSTDVADLFRRAKQPGAPRFFPQQNRRFESTFQEIWKIIKSGKLGNVFEVTTSQLGYQRRDDWQTIDDFGGGQLLNWGPHIIDQSLRLLGAPVKEQYSDRVLGAAGGDCDDHFSVHFIGENGRKVNMCISGSCALRQGRSFMAIGTRGAVEAFEQHVHIKYINPKQKLPPVISDPGTPGDSFGPSGTFSAVVHPDWIEKEYDVKGCPLDKTWLGVYESYRNGAEYPIKEEEVMALMQAIDRIRATSKVIDFRGKKK